MRIGQLSRVQRQVLAALRQGAQLKVHRDLDGRKVYRLYPLDADKAEAVAESVVGHLLHHQLIESNMKFPAATYLLTEKGVQAAGLSANHALPMTIRGTTVD